jgi:hypothetical protein
MPQHPDLLSQHDMPVIGPWLGYGTSGGGDAVWTGANTASLYPFRLSGRITTVLFWVRNGTVVNGNFDIGLYTADGTRLVSSGATAQAGISQLQTVAMAYTFGPGLFYVALAFDNIVARVLRNASSGLARMVGCAQMAAAYPLPATAVFAATASYIPLCGLTRTPRNFV